MQAISSLLAATDFSEAAERAARRAHRLSGELNAAFELLHVVDASALADVRGLAPAGAAAAERVLAEANRLMGEAAARLHPKTARVAVGELPAAILEAALAHDMLVLGSRGSGTLREAFLGTTAERCLLRSARPMLVVKGEPDAAYRRVLVPCEYAPPARRALELALRVAPTARITLVHVFEVPFAGLLRRASVAPGELDSLASDYEARARRWLAGLGQGLPGADALEVDARPGNPRQVLPAMAASIGADLVVMGKQGASRALELFLGSATRQVLAESPCDVLVAPLG